MPPKNSKKKSSKAKEVETTVKSRKNEAVKEKDNELEAEAELEADADADADGEVEVDNEAELEVEADADTAIPALEPANNLRERYEYRPVIHTEIVFRNPKDRITSEVMTRFELCEVMSIRAKQLETGRKIFTDVGNITDPLEIAKKEILDKKCPLSIVRMLTDKVAEKWHVNEMAIPYDAF